MLVLHFDYPSAASAVAVLRLQQVADEGGTVRFDGLDVLGLDIAVPTTPVQVEEYDCHRDAALVLGLPMRRPSLRPPTLAAHLVGGLADEVGLGAAWRWACLRAYWSNDDDLGDDRVLRRLGRAAGLDSVAVRQRLDDRDARLAARQHGLIQRRRGVGGVPVLELDGTFVGADLPHDRLRELAAL